MRAGVLTGAGRFDLRHVPEPAPGPRDIVLEIAACGVCGSDLPGFRAGEPAGRIMGHEFAGRVREVGREVTGIKVGERLTGLPIQPCGDCRRCRADLGHLCERWGTRSIAFGLPGAFAERLRIPDAMLGTNVHRLPDELDIEIGALVEPLAVAVHAVRQAEPRPGQSAVVIGLGTIGLQTGQVLRDAGVAPVVGVELSPLRRAVADRLGFATVDGGVGPDSVAEAVVAQLGGEPDLVVEASGAPSSVAQATRLVRPRGTVLLVALYHRPTELGAMAVVQREIVLRGSAMVTPADFGTAIEMLRSGRARATPLITHRRPLAELTSAFQTQLDAENSVKVLVTP